MAINVAVFFFFFFFFFLISQCGSIQFLTHLNNVALRVDITNWLRHTNNALIQSECLIHEIHEIVVSKRNPSCHTNVTSIKAPSRFQRVG